MKKLMKSLREQSDLRLVKYVQHGNNKAFTILVLRHSPDLRGIVHGILYNHDDEEDALQEVWKTVLPKLRKHIYKESGHFATWLHTLAYRIARKMKNREHRFVHDGNSMDRIAEDSNEYNSAETSQSALSLLKKLSRKMRLLVILHALRGKKFGEISKMTGIKENVARVLYGRAIHSLKEEINKMKGEKNFKW